MLKFLTTILLFVIVQAHSSKVQADGDLQSALIPQELNPEFVSDKDSPWRAIIPSRQRREVDLNSDSNSNSTINKLKTYSRIITSVVLGISAVIELVVYIIETYSV